MTDHWDLLIRRRVVRLLWLSIMGRITLDQAMRLIQSIKTELM